MQFNLKEVFSPKLFQTLGQYNRVQFAQDALAGIIVGIVAIPLAIAFGISSGVGPTEGLVTAIIAGLLISLFGGSKVQIGGPTGAFIVIIYGIIQQYGLSGLMIATVMAGILLIAMGLARLGTVIKFVPYPVIVGFTAGIAVTIFSTQMNDFFGLGLTDVPANFIDKWIYYAQHKRLGLCNRIFLPVGLHLHAKAHKAHSGFISSNHLCNHLNMAAEILCARIMGHIERADNWGFV